MVIGAGPTGLYLAIALARRGHEVTVVDRDPGPGPGPWDRRGVMQFHHPHAFRQPVLEALTAEMPEFIEALLAVGAVPATLQEQPDRTVGLCCRRELFERVLRIAALAEPGVTLRTGHAETVLASRGRVVGVRVDGHALDAQLVLDASGRAGRLTRSVRAPADGGDCGLAYVSRQYELLPGASEGPLNSPLRLLVRYSGYVVIVFRHDNRTFSTLIARPSGDRRLARLREPAIFNAAASAVPALASWTDSTRSRPITSVLPGGRLFNRYQGQLDQHGRLPMAGLLAVGDTVCTTNPAYGRGLALALRQGRQLLDLIDTHSDSFADIALAFDHWCTDNIRPWFTDDLENDADVQRRWSGADVNLTRRLPSDLIVAAAEADPRLMPTVGPYLAMQALPASLDAVEPLARALYVDGWRPPVPAGPTRDDLAELIDRTAADRPSVGAAA